MMRAHKSAVLVTGAILFAGAFLSGQALSQNAPAQPAVQGASIMPIGKVVTAAGSISIEHVSAVVVQASLGGQSGDAKVTIKGGKVKISPAKLARVKANMSRFGLDPTDPKELKEYILNNPGL